MAVFSHHTQLVIPIVCMKIILVSIAHAFLDYHAKKVHNTRIFFLARTHKHSRVCISAKGDDILSFECRLVIVFASSRGRCPIACIYK